MYTDEGSVWENPYEHKLSQNNSNERSCQPYNIKRSAQQLDGDEAPILTPKHSRLETSSCDTGTNMQPSKFGQNEQRTTGSTTARTTTSYFNTNNLIKKNLDDSSTRLRRDSSRQRFPPFRITLQDISHYPPTELSILKEINKHCKLNLTNGRYTKTSDNHKCLLLYTNTTTQFEYLMHERNWPTMINNTKYKLDIPNKIPPSYSIVVQNVPSHWDALDFGNELKQHYSTVVRAVRLFINGGRPLSKVRVDFSSYKELSTIIKAKRILLDDENTAFAVEPYVPPTRILRCYNCQAYDDHIAAHCPNKNNPVCFRCSQNHPYNPNCKNTIKCAHCQGEHMAGNPSCPVKSGKRQEKHQQLKMSYATSLSAAQQQQQHAQIWSGNSKELLFGAEISASNAASTTVKNGNKNPQQDVLNMLNKINNTMLHIKQQQADLSRKFDIIDMELNHHKNDIIQIKHCVYEILCPLVKESLNQIHVKTRGTHKQTILSLQNKLVEFLSMNTLSTENAEGVHGDKTSASERTTSACDLSHNDI